jgi:hypothetical protein
MPENTLLGLVGNLLGFDMPKSTTSADLPTVPEMAHSYIDQIKDTYDQRQQIEMQIQGKGLGMLEWANIGVPFGASKQMAPLLKSIKEQLRWEKAQISVLSKYLGKESADVADITGSKMSTALAEQLMKKYSEGLPQFKSIQDLDKYVGFEKYVGKTIRELSGIK